MTVRRPTATGSSQRIDPLWRMSRPGTCAEQDQPWGMRLVDSGELLSRPLNRHESWRIDIGPLPWGRELCQPPAPDHPDRTWRTPLRCRRSAGFRPGAQSWSPSVLTSVGAAVDGLVTDPPRWLGVPVGFHRRGRPCSLVGAPRLDLHGNGAAASGDGVGQFHVVASDGQRTTTITLIKVVNAFPTMVVGTAWPCCCVSCASSPSHCAGRSNGDSRRAHA